MKRHIRLRRLCGLVAVSRGKAIGYPRLTVSGVRRALIYKPLAILMSMLLLPSIPGVQRLGVGDPADVQAQIGSCTATTGNSIIRNYCSADGLTFYLNDLKELEADAVEAYLTSHFLPATDAQLIYDYGRTDLRTQIRALMSAALLAIAAKIRPRALPTSSSCTTG